MTGSGPPPDLVVKVQDLRDDAARWAGYAQRMATARETVAQRLVLETTMVSFQGSDVREAYNRVRSKIIDRLTEAERSFTGVAEALTSAAAQYEADERSLAHQIAGTY